MQNTTTSLQCKMSINHVSETANRVYSETHMLLYLQTINVLWYKDINKSYQLPFYYTVDLHLGGQYLYRHDRGHSLHGVT